jgi:hypothetical protein
MTLNAACKPPPLNYPHLLELTAKLSSLAIYPGTEMIYSDSIQQTAQESKAIKKALALPNIKRLNPEQLNYFTQFLKLERVAVSPLVKKAWRQFIFDCVQDTKKTQSLARMLEFYLLNQIESDWLHTSFSKAIREEYSLHSLEKEFLATQKEIEALQLNVPKNLIHYWESQIQTWEHPDQFDALWANYEKDTHSLITTLTSKMELEPLSKKALFATIHALTDMMDKTIKSLKGSPEYAEKIGLQVERFDKLLQPYHQLMRELMRVIPNEKYEEWLKRIGDDRYNKKEPMLQAIEGKFSMCHANLGPHQLNASNAFSVDAVRIGSTASFGRQFVNHKDITLEDLFTLTHQNILSSIQYLTEDIQLRQQDLPDVFQPFLKQINTNESYSKGMTMQLLSIRHHHPIIELEYNIPLQNHSAKCFLKYNSLTENIQFKFQMYGMNWANRMSAIAVMASIESQLLDVKVKQEPRYSNQTNTLEFTWELPAQQVQQSPTLLLDSIKQYCQMTDYINSLNSSAVDDLPAHAEKLFLRHPNVMKKVAFFLRLSQEERKNIPWLERAFLWDFIVGTSNPDTKVACQHVLKNFTPTIFQDNQAIKSLLSLLPFSNNSGSEHEQLKKRIVTIIDYYITQGAVFDPLDNSILVKIAQYPELLPSYLDYLRKHPNEYLGKITLDEIITLSTNQEAITELIQLGIIDLGQLSIQSISHDQLRKFLLCSSLKAPLLKQLYENSSHNQQPSIQTFSSNLRSHIYSAKKAENNETLLAELLANPSYKPFVIESFQTDSDSKSEEYYIFENALKKNHLELCHLFLQMPKFVKNLPDNIWTTILEHNQLKAFISDTPVSMLNPEYDNFFHEKLFTQLKSYLDANPLMITTSQLIKLVQWNDKEKQQVILGHPHLAWKKSSLEQTVTMQMNDMEMKDKQKEIEDQEWMHQNPRGNRPRRRLFNEKRSYWKLEAKLNELNEFWKNVDQLSSDYAIRELFFKAEWIPREEDQSYVDYIKYQYDATHTNSLPRLSAAIKTGDIQTVSYYLGKKIPEALTSRLVKYALHANQLELAHYLMTQQEYPLKTLSSWALFYFAAKNGDVVFWQHFLASDLFEKLPSKLFILEAAPANTGLNNLYGGTYGRKNPLVQLLDYLIEHNKEDIVALLLKSPKFDWPFLDKDQEELIASVEKSPDNNLVQLVLKKLNMTQEDRTFLSQSLKPPVLLSEERKTTLPIDTVPVVNSINLIQEIYQQQPKNEVTSVALTKLIEMANQACYQNVNCISKKDYQALQQSYRQYSTLETISTIETTLNTLQNKIATIDQHHFPDAKNQAKELLANLEQYKTQYERTIQNEPSKEKIKTAGEQFGRDCKEAIDKAKPILKRDLNWGDYLKNLAKALANAIIKVVTRGKNSSFFACKKAALLEVVEIAEQDLKPK